MHRHGSSVRWFLVALLLLLLTGGAPAGADGDPSAQAEQEEGVRAELLGILRLRLEARLEEARLLIRTGATDEALAVLRNIETLHRTGMAEINNLTRRGRHVRVTLPLERVRAERAKVQEGEIGIGGGAGGAFRGRGGTRSKVGSGRAAATGVEDALRWLAAHQSPNGSWEAAGFGQWCDGKPVSDRSKQPDGSGKKLYDPGVTGLALCAFLGGGYTNRGKHPFAQVISRGLRYLKNIQDPEGCFGPRTTQQYIYNHAIASLAMVEAYGMTGSPIFKSSAQRALDYIALARNPYFAWRYGIKPGDNDTAVSGWMMMALKSAQLINADSLKRGRAAPLVVDEQAFMGLKAWLDKVTDAEYGRVGYVQRGTGPARPQELVDRFPAEKSESMTAVGMLARIFMGEDPQKSKLLQLGAKLCAKLPPTWNVGDGSIDMYYWYYGSLAMFQMGGTHWRTWRRAMDGAIIRTQRKDTDSCQYKGSWDPVGPWGPDGGRVYATALMAMSLEVAFRYDRVFRKGPAPESPAEK